MPGLSDIAALPDALLARLAKPERPARQPDTTLAASFDQRPPSRHGVTAYAAGALEKAAHNVATAPNGTRNIVLNKEAYSLGGFIASGELRPQQVIEELATAARAAGLEDAEIERTLVSGLNSGAVKPRTTPEPVRALPNGLSLGTTTAGAWSTVSSAAAMTLPPGADNWRVYTLKDARRAQPSNQWLVHGLVEAGSLSIWYGAPGDLKSFLLQDLAVCVASGKRWLNNSVAASSGLAVVGGPVIWVDADMGERRTAGRFKALAAAYQLPDDTPLFYLSMPNPQPDLENAQHVRALIGLAQQHNARLLVFDNLGVMIGQTDENGAAVQRPMTGFRSLAEATGAAVIIVHHQRKATGGAGRLGDTLRGHSSIEAKLDVALLVRREGDHVSVFPTKVRGAEIKPFGALFTYTQDEHLQLTEARFWSADMVNARAEALEVLWQKVRSVLAAGPATTNRICVQVRANRKAVADLLKSKASDGALEHHKGPRNSDTWSLPA